MRKYKDFFGEERTMYSDKEILSLVDMVLTNNLSVTEKGVQFIALSVESIISNAEHRIRREKVLIDDMRRLLEKLSNMPR